MLTPSRRIAGIKKRAAKASEVKASTVVKAVGYIRVSTEEQAQTGHGLESQERAVRSFAVSQGYDLIEVESDKGVSGATPPFERPGFGRLMEMAEAKAFSVLLVNKFDRLARNIVFSVMAVKELDEKYGVAIRSVTEPIDSGTPMGRTIFAIFAGMAEQEREVITDRMHGGRKEKAIKGGFAGGEAPYGYRNDRDGGLVVEPAEAEIVRRIFAMRADGMLQKAIADRLNAEGIPTKRGKRWWQSQIGYILENRKYHGAVEYLFRRNGTETHVLKKGRHKAIVSQTIPQAPRGGAAGSARGLGASALTRPAKAA